MTTPLLTNFAESTLQAQISMSATELTVDAADASKFPSPGVDEDFKIILWDGVNDPEICSVTARAGEVFTVVRAQEGTAARVWDAYTQVKHAITAAVFDYFLAAAASLKGTSVTSLDIGTGNKTLTTQANKLFGTGQWLLLTSDADPTNDWMLGQSVSYGATTLQVNVQQIAGSGNHSDWTIRVSGPVGPTGATGAAGADGDDGAPGDAGIPGINGRTIRNGAGVPSSALGVDGDFYIDTSGNEIFGPKSGGAWGTGTSIIGAAGSTGSSVGVRWNFSTTITDADPGDGIVRFNHGTFLSITKLFIDELDASGSDQTPWLTRLDDSTNTGDKGTIRFQKKDDDSVFAEFQVTGAVVDKTGYREVPVTPLAGAVPANLTQLVAYFAATGDAGSSFVALSDTPANFTGAADKLLVVNSTPDAVEFKTLAEVGIATVSQVFDEYVFIETPEDKDYRIFINSSFARTIDEITTRSESGTCTLTGKINTTPLGGTANAVSGTEQTRAHVSANVMSVGDDLVLTISANSSCLGISVKIKCTRTLA